MHRPVKVTDQDGMALVLTLMAVSFMVAITVQLFSSVNWQMQASVNLRDSVMLDAMTRSGLSLARAALLADQRENKFDSPHDSWNALGSDRLGSSLSQGRLDVAVTDLSGLLQVNGLVVPKPVQGQPGLGGAKQVPPVPGKSGGKQVDLEALQKKLWVRFLTSGRFAVADDDEAESLVTAIQDWIDADDNERGDKGAEKGYYRSHTPSYEPRNGPVQYKEELLLIRGMTRDLFYGNEEYAGIADFLSVAGKDGKVNINSAPAEILQALAENLNQEMARDLIEFREDEQNKDKLSRNQWYKTVISGDVEIQTEFLTVVSKYFLVTSMAQNNDIVRVGKGVIFRDENEGQKLVSWEVR